MLGTLDIDDKYDLEAYSGGAMGAQLPLDQWKLWISGGFQAPTGAEPPPRIKKIPEHAPDCD